MAFGEGFLAGLQVGQQYRHKEELMRQRKEDRDIEAYGRDLESLMNDWQNTKGDRTDEEFVNSEEFASLAKRHRNSKVLEKAIQTGLPEGKVAKLRDIRKSPDGRNVLIVDTYDKNGRLISKGRPVTEDRSSREDNPNAKVLQLTNKEMYQGLVGALQQSPDYVDRRGLADRFEATVSAVDPAGKSVTKNGKTAPISDDNTPPPKPEAPLDSITKPTSTVEATPVPEDPQAPAEPLPTPAEQVAAQKQQIAELEAQHNALRAELDELEDVDNKRSSQMTHEQYIAHRRELAMKADQLGQIQGQLDELTGGSMARRMGASLSEVPGDFVRGVGEFGEAIADIPAVKGVSKVVGDFLSGLRTGEGTPPPKGTKQSERFEYGADAQVLPKLKDKKGPLDPSNLKDRSRAQQNKIEDVAGKTALAVANNEKLSRKMLNDYRKALRAQVVYGDITPAQATASYYAVLAATKSKDSYKLQLDSKNGVAFLLNEADGSVTRSQYANPTSDDKGPGSQSYSLKDYKQLVTMGEIITRGDEHRLADFMAVADQTRDALGLFNLAEPGTHSVLSKAFGMWESKVNSAANWNPFLSVAGSKSKNPSLSPFIASQVLSVPMDDRGQDMLDDFAGSLAIINGGNKLTEEHWAGVIAMAQAYAKQGVTGKAALDAIVRELSGK